VIALPSLQLLSESLENALGESESTLLSSREAWEHLVVLRSTGEVTWSIWEVSVWIVDKMTFV